MKRLSWILLFLLMYDSNVFAQFHHRYKREVVGVENEGWHAIVLPAEMFKRLDTDLSDVRLYAIEEGDTLEIPYLLRIQNDEVLRQKLELPLFNRSSLDGVLYLTFAVPESQPVNFLELEFAEPDYFARVTVEGSDDRQQWFEMAKDQRIVSITKDVADFHSNTIRFQESRYRFIRLGISSDVPLDFTSASFAYNKIKAGKFNNVSLTWNLQSDRKLKHSCVDIMLQHYVPVSILNFEINHEGDFYRAFELLYVHDSTRTNKGWVKQYRSVSQGYLTSFKENTFNFPVVFAKELRLIIRDLDNLPLKLTHISAAGPEVTLISKLEQRTMHVFYGASAADAPLYDLAHFHNTIPGNLAVATLADEQILITDQHTKPLFQNRMWLWGVMALMISGLAFFTIRMMKKE